nr:hypothetical protein CFP56_79045 [Quercus suber]
MISCRRRRPHGETSDIRTSCTTVTALQRPDRVAFPTVGVCKPTFGSIAHGQNPRMKREPSGFLDRGSLASQP